MRKSIARVAPVSVACLVLLALSSCPFPSSGSVPIVVSSESITLAWDPPAVSFPSPPLAAVTYRVYYCQHGSGQWIFLSETPASTHPQVSLKHSDFGDGSYDFAVSAVNSLGQQSSLHTSLDASADPYGGWHIVWIGSD
jgi:hypothetical protein